MGDVILSVEGLRKRYGERLVLDSVSFAVRPGEVVAVVGPNGAGKSTLLRCIVGLARYEAGRVTIGGFDAARQGKSARRQLGYLAQEPAFPGDMTVMEAVALFAGLRRVERGEALATVRELRLDGELGKRIAELSGGMRRRLALAVSSLGRPPLLVLDEPASGLDVALKAELREFVRRYRESGRSVLFATHVLEDIPRLADRVLVLANGRAVYLGPSAGLLMGAGESLVYVRANGAGSRAVEELLRAALPGREVRRVEEWVIVACSREEKLRALRELLESGVPVDDVRTEEAPVEEAVRALTEGHR